MPKQDAIDRHVDTAHYGSRYTSTVHEVPEKAPKALQTYEIFVRFDHGSEKSDYCAKINDNEIYKFGVRLSISDTNCLFCKRVQREIHVFTNR